MEPTTLDMIKSWPNMTEEEAKLIFIRKSATEAYANGEIESATKDILKTVVELIVVNSMSKDLIAEHIGNLEIARSFLAAFTQGLMTGVASEAEPIFKAKHEKERKEKLAAKIVSAKDKKVNELIEKARELAMNPTLASSKKSTITKQICEKCKREVFSLKFHKC